MAVDLLRCIVARVWSCGMVTSWWTGWQISRSWWLLWVVALGRQSTYRARTSWEWSKETRIVGVGKSFMSPYKRINAISLMRLGMLGTLKVIERQTRNRFDSHSWVPESWSDPADILSRVKARCLQLIWWSCDVQSSTRSIRSVVWLLFYGKGIKWQHVIASRCFWNMSSFPPIDGPHPSHSLKASALPCIPTTYKLNALEDWSRRKRHTRNFWGRYRGILNIFLDLISNKCPRTCERTHCPGRNNLICRRFGSALAVEKYVGNMFSMHVRWSQGHLWPWFVGRPCAIQCRCWPPIRYR